MKKIRGFEVVSKYAGLEDQLLPRRSTLHAAGYDFYAAEETIVPPLHEKIGTVLVPTGVKAYMPDDEFLLLVNRSSSPRKFNLALPNGVGIIDADYYDNVNNEGEIFLQLINYGKTPHTINKGDRICQGIFMNYKLADDDIRPAEKRLGGFGSSGQ